LEQEPTRQERIEACLKEVLQQPDFPAISQHIQQLMQALQDDEASLRYLTSLVLRDYSLTLKVLRTANSAQYNRSGRPILSVSHAVVLLGSEAIRYLAGSLTLFDHFQKLSPGLKELMLLSLLTANQARAAAIQINYPRREEAYLCGMLCNLGEVLIACYFPQQYAAILRLVKEDGRSVREAVLEVLGFAYEELGQAVARQWKMPESVEHCIRKLGTQPPTEGLDPTDLLSHLISFSHGLTNVVYRGQSEGVRARVRLLMQDYYPVLELQKDQVDRMLDSALLDTKSTFQLLNIPLDSLRLSHQAEAAIAASPEPAPAVPESPDDIAGLSASADLWEQLTREIEHVVHSSAGLELSNVLLMILEAIYRGGRFDRVLFGLVNPDHTHIHGRVALGEGADALRERFRFPLSPRGGPIGAALHMARELYLPGYGGASFAESETLKMLGAASFGLLPIVVDRVLVGCLYFDRMSYLWRPDPRTAALLEKLRDLAAVAIEKSRAGAPD